MPCLAWLVKDDEGNASFRHKVFESVDKFCEFLPNINYTKSDFYFGISTLKEESINVGGRKRVRVQQNSLKTRAFVLDVDVRTNKPGTHKYYETKEEALEGVQKIVNSFSLPQPTIVDSGFGLHVYWPMAAGVDSSDWMIQAKRFKNAIQVIAPEIVADGSRVADSAGVLRIPGSFNLKNKQLTPVNVIQVASDVVDFGAFKNLMARLVGSSNALPVASGVTTTTQTPSEPVDLHDVAKNCKQVEEYLKNSETASEPEWYAVLGLVPYLFAKDDNGENIYGPDLAHKLSNKHPEYDPEKTYFKYTQAKTAQSGPTTCERLRGINPERCEGCPFATTVKTPISTAKLDRPATTEETVVTKVVDDEGNKTTEQVTIPLPPKPYFRGESGGVYTRHKVKDPETQEWTEVIERVYDYDLYPIKRFRTESLENEGMEVHLWLPKDGLRKFKMPNGLLADNRSLTRFLNDKGVVAAPGQGPSVTKFLIDYVRHLQMEKAAEVEYSRFGWRDVLSADPRFVLADGSIDRTGTLAPCGIAPFLKEAGIATNVKGTLDGWKQGFSVYQSVPHSEPYILAAMLGFAAPLMALTEYAGVLYNMNGHSAAGKSTSLKVMTSVWGKPNPQLVDIVRDTDISAFNMVGYLGNIPVSFDELTKLDGDRLSTFVLTFTGGRGKMRADRNGQNRQNETFWDTIVCSTSNTSLYDKLANSRKGYSAEAMRIFELQVPMSDDAYKSHVDIHINLLRDNYGHAGREFIRYVLPRTAQIKPLLDKAIELITRRGQLRNEERFWGALLACVLVGGKIARDTLKLHNYNVEGIVDFALGLSNEVRTQIQTTISDPISTLAEFFNSNLSSLLRTNDGRIDLGAMNNAMYTIKARIENKDGRPHQALISIASIREWCKQRNIDAAWLRQELVTQRIIIENNVQTRLTSGTNLPAVNCKCWRIDMTHEKLVGLAEVKYENLA